MNFIKFRDAVNSNFMRMCKEHVFEVNMDSDKIWNTYLQAFPEGTNPMFRERTEHDCSCCRNFIRNIGNVVRINPKFELETVWDVQLDDEYQIVADALAKVVKETAIANMYYTKESCYGTKSNPEVLEDGKVRTWSHFYAVVPSTVRVNLPDTVKGRFKADYDVFKRSLTEITTDAIGTVLDLIKQNSIYRGAEHLTTVQQLAKLKREYDKLSVKVRDNYLWAKVAAEGSKLRFNNTVIGTLLADISSGIELEKAVKSFESKVAPQNYKRTTAPVTQTMIDKAKDKVTELGLEPSLYRRHATESDLSVNNVLFVDRTTKLKDSLFDDLTPNKGSTKPNFDKVQEISYKDFITQVLPTAEAIDIYFDNKHTNNMMSLVAPTIPDAPNLFKWDNGFSWSYVSEVTDSMKERVKAAGGSVTGVLRFSIQWNEEKEDTHNDLDAHCKGADGHIYFANPSDVNGGRLDVDIRRPMNKVAVENITWPNLSKMRDGNYEFYVKNYSGRNSKGFRAQIEFDGQIFEYAYNGSMREDSTVQVAVVNLHKGKFSIQHKLDSSSSSTKELWDVNSNNWVKVKTILKSPNHWDGQEIGNEHLFFILENCKNPDSVRGFYNEFLKNELTEHRKVFEMLSSRSKIEYSENQLSGIGFSSTKPDSVYCKVSGAFNRVIKINF